MIGWWSRDEKRVNALWVLTGPIMRGSQENEPIGGGGGGSGLRHSKMELSVDFIGHRFAFLKREVV